MSKPIYTVFKIDKFEHGNNSFRTDREESWIVKKDNEFEDYEEARKYVIDKNRIHSDLPNFIVDLQEKEKEEAVCSFCFSDEYEHLRVYFLGKPDINKIKSKLTESGVTVKKV